MTSPKNKRNQHRLQHDPYPRPVIAEALCEIHFDPLTSARTGLEWVDKIHQNLKSAYTGREDGFVGEYRAEIKPEGVSVQASPTPSQRTILRHADQTHILQFSPGLLAVNEIASYPGWTTFKRHIEGCWKQLLSVGEAKAVRRVGLRYINRIKRSKAQEPVGTWLSDSGYFPKHLLDCSSLFMSRFEHSIGGGGRLIVTVAEEASQEDLKPIIFDIDAIYEREFETDWLDVEASLESLHQEIWNAFRESASVRLLSHMEGKS